MSKPDPTRKERRARYIAKAKAIKVGSAGVVRTKGPIETEVVCPPPPQEPSRPRRFSWEKEA